MKSGDKIWLVVAVMTEGGAFTNGVFFTESEAVANCRLHEAVTCTIVNRRFPNHICENECFYYPRQETKGQSVFSMWQRKAEYVVNKFLASHQ